MSEQNEAIEAEAGQDVSEGVEFETSETGVDFDDRQLSPRDEKLQSIIDKRNSDEEGAVTHPEMLEVQGDDLGEDNDLEASTGNDQKNEVNEEYEEDEQLPPVYLNDKGIWVTKVDIGGVVVERPFDNVLRTAQKHENADVRLERISQREQELNTLAQQIEVQHQQINQLQQNNQLSDQDADAMRQELMDGIRQYQEQTYDGDENAVETLANVMFKIAGRQQQAILDPEQIAEAAASKVEAKNAQKVYDQSLDVGVTWLQENHSELLTDPVLYSALDRQTELIEKESPKLTPEQVIRKATENVLQRFKPQKEEGQEQTALRGNDNQKRNLKPMPPRQSQVRQAPSQKEVVDTSPSGVIARMQEARSALANR